LHCQLLQWRCFSLVKKFNDIFSHLKKNSELQPHMRPMQPHADRVVTTNGYRLQSWLDNHRDFGAVFIRAFAATFLVYMSQDNVFSASRMDEFERFLQQFRFPMPAVAARVSVYAQFGCAICFAVGAFVRPAAALMIVNFLAALLMVHTRLPFREALDPAAMLASALFLFVHGAGPLSLDERMRFRRRPT